MIPEAGCRTEDRRGVGELLLSIDITTNVTLAYLRMFGVPQTCGRYGLYSQRHNYIKFIRLTQLSEGGFSAERVMAMVHWLRFAVLR